MRSLRYSLFAFSFAVQIAVAAPATSLWQDDSGLKSFDGCKAFTQPVQVVSLFAEQVAEITDVPEAVVDQIRGQSLVGTFWQAVRDNQGYAALNCGGTEYLLFDVHTGSRGGTQRVAAQVNSRIFQFVKFHSPEEAEAAIAPVGVSAKGSLVEGVNAFEGGHEYVVCGQQDLVDVFDDKLTMAKATVGNNEKIKPVQSWGINKQTKNGVTFVRVQFDNQRTGWLDAALVKPRSVCLGVEKAEPMETLAAVWNFPTVKRTTHNYKEGQRRFKAPRSGGRLHAACDLYRVKGEAAQAVTDGTVVRGLYYFYEGTYALEIKHTGGKIVRYGEVTGSAASGVSVNKKVTQGQTIGYIGKVNSGCCNPMLHFEMYAGTASGPLTQSGNSFQRRKDLLDPSAYLTDWEKTKFGVAY